MKVGIVCAFDTYFDRVALLKEFYQKRAQVKVIASDFSHRKKEKNRESSLVDEWIDTKPYHKNLSVARLTSHYDFSKKAEKLLEAETWDVLHVFVPCNSLVKFMALIKHKQPKTKLIFDLIDLWPETMPISKFKNVFPFTLWKQIRDKDLDQADLIFTECKLYQQVLQKEDNEKYKVLYWARQEKPLESHLQIKDTELSFCYLGSMNHIIDIDFIEKFLSACQQYRLVTLHLIGDGESKEQLIQNVKRKGVQVIDHQKVYDQKKKQEIFDQCNYALNVMKESVVVGLTMKSLDYMCGQIPLINTIGGDTREFCETCNIGFHVPFDQIELYAQKVCTQTLQEQYEQRKQIKHLYETVFTKDSFFKTMQDAWEKLI
ncbi:glycosyltransferase [Faecalicoccus pleomorphus]|uniref:glycosyltransferase n=1 Tax=Faecalicoccus pleomorphus TaxID=1323 RepID=UPI00189A5F64|nr:glycosyltransferase [Faecalicoccus pleomorphus]MDB7983992.1 glycosyltransferase [Faecalicoccus pleomorphus]